MEGGYLQAGLVLLGDAFQSVCPTTGTGLSKVLTDVDVFCHDCVPDWLATSGMGIEKLPASIRILASSRWTGTHSKVPGGSD